MTKKEQKQQRKYEKEVAKAERRIEKVTARAERKKAKAEGKKQKAVKLNSQTIRKIIKRIRAQFGLQPVITVLAAAAALFIMTWLIRDVLGVEHIYAAAGFELIGIAAFMIAFLVPVNIIMYRRRVREVVTLSDAIQRVAGGDFKSRISTEKKTGMTPIYEDFNKMCDELESVSVLRNDFINNYSHEFKTPIASINGFAELLMERELPQEEQKKYLKIIADESARLSKLSSNSTLLSRLSSQQIVSDIEEYDLGAQLRECSILLSAKWLEKDIAFDGEAIPVSKYRGNKEMMQHLWINLLDNAIKYTPEGGEIAVSLEEKDGYAVVRIRDTGEGISDEAKARLFIPYFQADSSHSKEGLGLGLSIVMRIIELCGGTIEVDSVINEGSTFTVKLPLE